MDKLKKLYEVKDMKTEVMEIINRLKDSGWFKLKFNSRGILIKHNIAYYFVTDNAYYQLDMSFDEVINKLEEVLLRDYKLKEFYYEVFMLIKELYKNVQVKSTHSDFEEFAIFYILRNTDLDEDLDEITKVEFSYADADGDHLLYITGKKDDKMYKAIWDIGRRECHDNDSCVDYYTIPKLLKIIPLEKK